MGQGVSSTPTNGMLYLAAYLRKYGFDPPFADGWLIGWDGVEQRIIDYKPDIIGLTSITGGRHKAVKVAEIAKRIDPKILVVLGGVHPTIMWKQMLEHYPVIDIIVRGEGEITLLEIAQGKALSEIDGICYRHNDRVIRNKDRELIADLDDIPFPAWDLHDLRAFSAPNNARPGEIIKGIDASREPVAPMIFSRGCPGRCNFCSTWWIWKCYRRRTAKNLVDEVELLHNKYNIKSFKFVDDCFTDDKEAIMEFCDEVERRKLNIIFTTLTRGDRVDEEMLERLQRAGNYLISFGVESGSQKILDIMRKEIDLKKVEENIMICKKVGLRVNELLIVGNIGETIDTVNDTVEFVKRTQPDVTSVSNGMMIFPGTQLYQHSKRVGLIDEDFWVKTEHVYAMYTHGYPKWMLDVFTHAVINHRRLPRSKFMVAMRNHRYFTRSIKDRIRRSLGTEKHKKRIKGYYPNL